MRHEIRPVRRRARAQRAGAVLVARAGNQAFGERGGADTSSLLLWLWEALLVESGYGGFIFVHAAGAFGGGAARFEE